MSTFDTNEGLRLDAENASSWFDTDDLPAEALWALEGSRGAWVLAAHRYSPQELQEQARSMNLAAYGGVAAAAGKHSNPPASQARERPYL